MSEGREKEKTEEAPGEVDGERARACAFLELKSY